MIDCVVYCLMYMVNVYLIIFMSVFVAGRIVKFNRIPSFILQNMHALQHTRSECREFLMDCISRCMIGRI